MHRQVGTEYLYAVTLLAVYIRDINHADIHADISYVVGLLTVHKAIGLAVTQVTVQAIGITYRNCCYA